MNTKIYMCMCSNIGCVLLINPHCIRLFVTIRNYKFSRQREYQ